VLFLAVLAYLFWRRPSSGRYATVHRGPIRGTVIATGEVVSAREAALSSGVTGRVSTVPVELGENVVSGTLLLSIEVEALRFRVEKAQLRLETAQLRLERALEGPRPEELAIAQADLDLAEIQRAALEAGPQGEDIAIARQEVVQAQASLDRTQLSADVAVETARLAWETAANALRDAQENYSRIYWDNERIRQRGIELSQAQMDAEAFAWRRVEDAEAAMEQARLAYEQALRERETSVTTAQSRLTQTSFRLEELLEGATEVELAQAQVRVEQAQASLALLQADPSENELQLLRNEIRLAEMDLLEAQSDLAKSTLTAPFDGTVIDIASEEGEYVGSFTPLVWLADLNQLHIEAHIDEIDVGQVAPGQLVTITLDAFPGQPLRGYIETIAPSVDVERGSAFYLTTIGFSNIPTLSLRLGMAANLTIVTVEKDRALLVPRQAVERVGSGNYVTVLRGRNQERVRVTLGIADSLHYEVLSGLDEGDRVLLP
jgi:HlyD family secretion protein